VKRNKNLTLLKGSKVFCSSAIQDWNCFSLLGFSVCNCRLASSVHRSSLSFNLYAFKNKIGRVSVGFTRVGRVPGRPAGSTGFRRANSQAGFCLDPDRSHARVGRVPGRPAGPVRVSKLWYILQVEERGKNKKATCITSVTIKLEGSLIYRGDIEMFHYPIFGITPCKKGEKNNKIVKHVNLINSRPEIWDRVIPTKNKNWTNHKAHSLINQCQMKKKIKKKFKNKYQTQTR